MERLAQTECMNFGHCMCMCVLAPVSANKLKKLSTRGDTHLRVCVENVEEKVTASEG